MSKRVFIIHGWGGYPEEGCFPWLKNDPFVPIIDAEIFKNKLGAKIIIEHNQGHFSGSDGITELPSALGSILEIVK